MLTNTFGFLRAGHALTFQKIYNLISKFETMVLVTLLHC